MKTSRVQKSVVKGEQNLSQSSSSSSSGRTNKKGQEEQVEAEEPAQKKMMLDDSFIEDLPPEMLMKVLKSVDTRTLFSCRLVNQEWNSISSQILRCRPETEIKFIFDESSLGGFMEMKEGNGKTSTRIRSLEGFVSCFKESKENCPLAHFHFHQKQDSKITAFFDHKDWIQFLLDFKDKSLKLKLYFDYSVPEFETLVERVRDLLLNKIPHLEELGLDLGYACKTLRPVKLFPADTQDTKSPSSSPSATVELPQLKVLHAYYFSFSSYPEIFSDLLNAAINLRKVQPMFLESNQLYAEGFEFLHSFGKLHCLQDAHIDLNDKFLSMVKQMAVKNSAPLPFKLKKLKLTLRSVFKNPSSWTQATNFISNLFQSTKTTLTVLSIQPLGFLNNLKLPTFPNLIELNLSPRLQDFDLFGRAPQMFPSGIRSAHVFPAVRFLDTEKIDDWCHTFPHEDSTPRFPSMKSLNVTDWAITGDCIAKIALLCPHLKDFQINRNIWWKSRRLNFYQVGQAIWTHLTQLESLKIPIHVHLPGHSPSEVDSCFTGISKGNCQRLADLEEEDKMKTEMVTVEREYPSILDMKDLNQLTINIYYEDDFYRSCPGNKLMSISQDYAFKLMPQLKITKTGDA